MLYVCYLQKTMDMKKKKEEKRKYAAALPYIYKLF